MYRVALVASHVIQYQAPFFRLLAASPELDLEVLYCSRRGAEEFHDEDMGTRVRWDLDLLGGYRHTFLPNYGSGDGYTRLINPGIVPKLLYGRYDAAIYMLGWGTVTSLLGIAACRMSGTRAMLFGDSSFPPPRRAVRDALLRAVIGSADAYLVSGALNADYYRHYGADERRFFPVPFAIDNERFANASAMTEDERRELRRKFLGSSGSSGSSGHPSPRNSEEPRGTEGPLLIVCSAKLVARKDPMTLLRAVAAMRHRDRAAVLLLGHGELREELERFARERNLNVHFAGFVNQTALPRYYAAGDVLVLPSTFEPRGLVVNEAMAAGLPVIASDRTGASGDLVRHGDNGFVFPAGDAEALAAQLDTLVEEPALRERMAQRSRELIARWDYSRGVAGVLEALRATC